MNTATKSTVNVNQGVARALREFLNESEEYEDAKFEKFSPDKLNVHPDEDFTECRCRWGELLF